MNERIKKLYNQCFVVLENESSNTGFDIKKFAELIVRECAQVSDDDITDGDACCTNTAYRIARQIKKHFGVEE
jgi:hypothetical protein